MPKKSEYDFPGSINHKDAKTISKFLEIKNEVSKICKKCRGMKEVYWEGSGKPKFKICVNYDRYPPVRCVLLKVKEWD